MRSFYTHTKAETFKNYRLWACDCTTQLLPDNEKTREIGVCSNQTGVYAAAKLSVYYDVLGKLLVGMEIADKGQSDLYCCVEKQVSGIPKDVISIYDRGYGSILLPFLHNFYGTKCVIRLKKDFSSVVKNFLSSDLQDTTITENINLKTYKKLLEMGFEVARNACVTYRLVKVLLSTGEVEVLMTNLGEEFTINDLGEIYRLRWGIETCFSCMKNNQMLGSFSGYSKKVVLQDIWCNLIFYNMQTVSQLDADKKAAKVAKKRAETPSKNKKKENKGYKINRNIGTGTLKSHFCELFQCADSQISKVIRKIEKTLLGSLEMIRDASRERVFKSRKRKRHYTEPNYKPAF